MRTIEVHSGTGINARWKILKEVKTKEELNKLVKDLMTRYTGLIRSRTYVNGGHHATSVRYFQKKVPPPQPEKAVFLSTEERRQQTVDFSGQNDFSGTKNVH